MSQRQDAAHPVGCRTPDGCGVHRLVFGDNPGGVAFCITPCRGRRHDARNMGSSGLPVARTPEGFHLGGAIQMQPLRGCVAMVSAAGCRSSKSGDDVQGGVGEVARYVAADKAEGVLGDELRCAVVECVIQYTVQFKTSAADGFEA